MPICKYRGFAVSDVMCKSSLLSSFWEKLQFNFLTCVLVVESCQRLFIVEIPVSEGRPSNYNTGVQMERNHYYCFYFLFWLILRKGNLLLYSVSSCSWAIKIIFIWRYTLKFCWQYMCHHAKMFPESKMKYFILF